MINDLPALGQLSASSAQRYARLLRDELDRRDAQAAEEEAKRAGYMMRAPATDSRGACVQRRDRLGGLLHEYHVAA